MQKKINVMSEHKFNLQEEINKLSQIIPPDDIYSAFYALLHSYSNLENIMYGTLSETIISNLIAIDDCARTTSEFVDLIHTRVQNDTNEIIHLEDFFDGFEF